MLPELKPYLTALAMPLTSLLLLTFISATLIHKRPKIAQLIIVISVTLLWLLSTNAFSVWMHNKLIPSYPAITTKDLKEHSVQAIVVLGGGVVMGPAGEYQLSKTSLDRLRLGAQLTRESGLPLVLSGGTGWGTTITNMAEADVAEKILQNSFGIKLQYKESSSRDTKENAKNSWELLATQGITRIALVTHSTHMPRAKYEFNKQGFYVLESTPDQASINSKFLLSMMPNASQLDQSQLILREFLANFAK